MTDTELIAYRVFKTHVALARACGSESEPWVKVRTKFIEAVELALSDLEIHPYDFCLQLGTSEQYVSAEFFLWLVRRLLAEFEVENKK